MVASFSEQGDQLSQWRGYADDSRGISVGFDLCNLRPPSSIGTAVTFAACLYKPADKSALVKAAFAHYRSGLLEWWESLIKAAREKQSSSVVSDPQFGQKLVAEREKDLRAVVSRSHATLQFDLLRAAPLLKHESFSEEKEWRLVLPLNGIPKRPPLEFRAAGDTLVPYIAYPLNKPDEDGPIPCKDVILGSGCHPSAEVGINLFLQKEQIMVLARRSQIPYRPT